MKSYRDAWAVSLLVIACVTIVLTVCSFAGIELPDALTRTLGVLDLIAVVVLVFTSVKLRIWKKDQ
ncbi:MAG: hypothetical protein E7576_00515 [Ruminococcaceae bacterium]|nr:hypothetical protein [Oscillospiraceae bacterium]